MTRAEAIEILKDDAYVLYEDDSPYNRQAFDMAIEALQEKKVGKWLSQVGGGYRCSECGRDALHDVGEKFALLFTKSKYCPHCGAKMEGEEDG